MNSDCITEMLRTSCEGPRCGRVLVALPVLPWYLGNQMTKQDTVPERLDKYGFAFAMEGYEVLFPRVASVKALAALKSGHTDRWGIKCLLCIADLFIERSRYQPEFRSWSGEIFGRDLGEKLRGLRGHPHRGMLLPWMYDQLEVFVVGQVEGFLATDNLRWRPKTRSPGVR